MNGAVWVTVFVVPVTVLVARFVLRDWKRVGRRLRREEMRTFQEYTTAWADRDAEYKLALSLAMARGNMGAYVQNLADEFVRFGRTFS